MNTAIVVGVDGTRQSLRAAAWAAGEAALRRAPLHVVNAFGIPDAFHGETMPPRDWLDSRRRESAEIVRRAVAAAGQPSLTVAGESVLDGPIPLLLRRSEDARMIVVGFAGRGVLGDLLVGSVATALTAHARCPVAVIRGEDRGEQDPVVAGVDGGPASESVLAAAFEEASLRGAPLVVVHVWADAEPGAAFAEALAGWRAKYPDVGVSPDIEQDKPRRRLLDWSTRAQLLVVGSRGRGGFTGLLLGSTSQALIQYAACPVLVVRSG
jgi:nucleotide-binding universal stress UspA family protein